MIGLDNPALHEVLKLRQDRLQLHNPSAVRTPFGWSFVGPSFRDKESCHDVAAISFQIFSGKQSSNKDLLDTIFRQFLLSENLDMKPG